jgi:tRNA-dihydrouridine synthase A
VAESGLRVFIVHARKAILAGLSPKENREVPPLRYDHRLPPQGGISGLHIMLNGGVRDLEAVRAHLAQVDGVMIGREAYHNPYFLAEIERELHGVEPPAREAVMAALPRVRRGAAGGGVRLPAMTRHLFGLYLGRPGARRWRRQLSEGACVPGAGVEVIREAMRLVA